MERIIRRKTADWRRLALVVSKLSIIFVIFVVWALMLFSCAGPQTQKSPAPGVYHIVKKGETAYSIARAYAIDLQELAEVNHLSDVSNIKEGSVLFIPDADKVIDDVMAAAAKAASDNGQGDEAKDKKKSDFQKPESSGTRPSQPDVKAPAVKSETAQPGIPAMPDENRFTAEKKEGIQKENGKFEWPVKGQMKSRFGVQPNKTYHNWIQITCLPKMEVRAAAAGMVIFSAPLKNFGETVIIRHADDFATVYTHLKKRRVKTDQSVKKGESIGMAGEVDHSGDTYINFEIRLKGKARNPLFYLP